MIGRINTIEKIVALLKMQGIAVSEQRKQELESMSPWNLAWELKLAKAGI